MVIFFVISIFTAFFTIWDYQRRFVSALVTAALQTLLFTCFMVICSDVDYVGFERILWTLLLVKFITHLIILFLLTEKFIDTDTKERLILFLILAVLTSLPYYGLEV